MLFYSGYEAFTGGRQRAAVDAYAGVISNSLWHFEPQAPTDYLTLLVAQQDYERFQILTEDGFSFVNVENTQRSALTDLLIALKLIKRVEIIAPIPYNGEIIGEINAIWLNKNIYIYFYVLVVFVLLIGVIGLYSRILHSNRELEMRVQERTAELHNANIDLRESEARYRSIFEDSPISLREEDFSDARKIVDGLRAAGVTDFQAYFAAHRETAAECMRAVKVLNVNQNTLELFKTDNKERLYEGLTDIFTDQSLESFGQQLAAFANGETHFDCETIQQTLTGEILWAGTRVSIAPGYEDTWSKVFISIVDITARKENEAERKLLQEEVHRYTEELEQRVADRTRELSVLYDVTAVASNVLDLDVLLQRLLEQSLLAIRRDAGIIHLFDESGQALQSNAAQGVPREISDGIVMLFANHGEAREMLEKHSTFVIPDLADDPRVPQSVRECGWRTYIGVPIQNTRGQLSGVLNIFGETDDRLTAEEATLLSAIADHIGLAVENVRLRRQAEQAAVQEDRQRLARELHDAVSQSLFSASVIAETLPRLWERDPLIVQQYLGDLHRLIRGALAEMRTLLLELRPNSLENAALEDLLRQLLDGIQGRTQLKASLQIDGQGSYPTRVKKNLFRIAQEALNNVVKHARARHVELTLEQNAEQVALTIADDGQGFGGNDVEGGHLGLQIMRERADNIGARLTVSSRPGQGTQISVIWPGEEGG